MKLLLVAACALVDADGRVLITQRPEGKAMAGLWEFPGGKIEPGETPEATLIRELKEELAIDTQSILPRAARLRQPHLSRLPPAHAALCVPALGGHRQAAGGSGGEVGLSEGAPRPPDAPGRPPFDRPVNRTFMNVAR